MKQKQIFVNARPWIIEFYTTTKTYAKQLKKSERDSYGVTLYHQNRILIDLESIKEDNKNLLSMVMHELGHALTVSLPNHATWKTMSDHCADDFEASVFYIEMAKDIIKDIK